MMNIDSMETFIHEADTRYEAYLEFIKFEESFGDKNNPNLLVSFDTFCTELDKGYGNSDYIQIARLYEDENGVIWYDNEYV